MIIQRRSAILLVPLAIMLNLTAEDRTGELIRGSTVVVVKSANQICVGADSKGLDESGQTYPQPICKIIRLGNFFVAHTGLDADRDSGFTFTRAVIQGWNSVQGSIDDKVAKIQETIKQWLLKICGRIKKENPKFFSENIEVEGAITFVIIGFKGDSPVYYSTSIDVSVSSSDEIIVDISEDNCLDDFGPAAARILSMGSHDSIDKFVNGRNSDWYKDEVDAIRALIKLEIDANPKEVGAPVDILCLTKNGINWIAKKPECK